MGLLTPVDGPEQIWLVFVAGSVGVAVLLSLYGYAAVASADPVRVRLLTRLLRGELLLVLMLAVLGFNAVMRLPGRETEAFWIFGAAVAGFYLLLHVGVSMVAPCVALYLLGGVPRQTSGSSPDSMSNPELSTQTGE
jgi:hypothetical protein